MLRRAISILLILVAIVTIIPCYAMADSKVSLTVPIEYSYDGNTNYSLTKTEYNALLNDVHQYIQDNLDLLVWSCQHYLSITANDDCTEFIVVVNALDQSVTELEAEDIMYEYGHMYAAYLKNEADNIKITYKNMLGDDVRYAYYDAAKAYMAATAASSNFFTLEDTSSTTSSSYSQKSSNSSSTKTQSQPVTKSADMVWIPATGKCYHSIPNCGKMDASRARQETRQWATANGYKRCSKCW